MNMAEREVEILRGHELRLLRCTLRPPPSDSSSSHFQHSDEFATSIPPLHALISNFLTSVESGDYFGALSSDAARLVLASPDSDLSSHSPDRVYSELLDRVESFINEPSINNAEKACRVFLVVCVAVAALFWFTQCNLTGPVDGLPKRPLPMKAWWEGSEMVEWENWARNQLMAAGSDLLGKFSYLQYIVFAKMLLLKTRDLLFEASVTSTFKIKSISWWLFRALLIHQRILDERSSSLFDLLQVFKGENSYHFGSLEKVTSYWGDQLQDGEASTIVSMVHLEAGVLEYIYGRLDHCRLDFESAELAAGLQLSVTGILGLRTVHQVEPKAQMILVANTNSESGSGDINTSITPNNQLTSPNVSEASDIFMTPKLVENGNDFGKNECGGVASTLTAVQQAVVLAQCLLIEKGCPHGEMQGWDMAPYIEAIDSQKPSFFILKCFCNTLRIRWESTRSRTKVRALQMMDNLVESIHKPSLGVPLRLPFCYAVYIPTIPALRKQYGEILVSCGLIGEALKVFEDLELWDNVIYCYRKLEKKAAAFELIKKQLSTAPKDPKLWCSLGDITHSDTCYEKALEVSNDRSARAKRSLAYNAYGRGEYEKSKILWESALALNSLYSNGWFALGASALKARDIEKALDGFTRAVQLDPENGEAWNNIACLHMVKKKNKESFIAFKEALKYKRDSWQMWENYSNVAFDVGNTGQALEAIKMVLNMTNNKRINVELLEKIMQYLEERTSIRLPAVNNVDDLSIQTSFNALVNSVNPSGNAEQTAGNLGGNEHLVEFLGKILQQIVRSESRPELWGLYARWHRIKGDHTMCCEALLKQVRSYQGSDLWKDRDRFKSFAQASLDLCKVYMDISSSTNSRRELLTAEMHLKNTLKQAGAFSDAEEFRNLETCLDEVRIKLQAEFTAT
ncbi:tetratricopeptide repeat protein 27-like isoform X1 [Hibiscus syriacus]|uniref:tetratricopeptide repeat protein 27-like isoform X1 n=1 Tax=Hibiscus syriacus TaxID=106335 RepID=UPI0019241A82|nr:tetratricopeptide repeat protein 27-like isoform X1 [Hibiscus syriacus]